MSHPEGGGEDGQVVMLLHTQRLSNYVLMTLFLLAGIGGGLFLGSSYHAQGMATGMQAVALSIASFEMSACSAATEPASGRTCLALLRHAQHAIDQTRIRGGCLGLSRQASETLRRMSIVVGLRAVEQARALGDSGAAAECLRRASVAAGTDCSAAPPPADLEECVRRALGGP